MKRINWKKIYLILLGFLALCWFLIRVIPKPSRATYPCQRAAFPIASAFVIWVTSLFSSALFFVKFRKSVRENKVVYAAFFLILFGASFIIYTSVPGAKSLFAVQTEEYSRAFWDNNAKLKNLNSDIISEFDIVGIVKSDQAEASDLSFEDIEALVRESVNLSGGIQSIITNGDYVVLKPNLVEMPPTPTPEYVEVSGMATDWRVVRAVAKMVRELNPDGKIYIIESSSATSTREVLNYYNYTLENIPEADQIVALEDSCGVFEDYSDNNLDEILLDDAIRLYPDEKKPNLSPEFYMNKIYNNADVVISIPVLKNHKTAIITGGVKNVAIGMAPPNIYGMTETFFGKWTKIDHSFENLNKWIHDFYLCKPVDFVIVDGLQGFDHGPTGIAELTMEEMQHNMRLIISGQKALSVDAVCGNIMSIDPSYANYMVCLDNEDYNVGTIDSRFIRLLGENMASIRDVFQHNVEITTNAIYTDYTPPSFSVNNVSIDENIITLTTEFDEDLNKIEIEINGELLNQVCINNFSTITFEVNESLLPIDEMKLLVYDRFFNKSEVFFDNLGIGEIPSVSLEQNYPNPFTESTTIEFSLKIQESVKLYISDISGKLIETIISEDLPQGNHQFIWESDVSSGTYFYILEVNGQRLSKQMIKK